MYLHTHDMYVCLLYVGIRKSWSYMLSISKGEKALTALKMDSSKNSDRIKITLWSFGHWQGPLLPWQ